MPPLLTPPTADVALLLAMRQFVIVAVAPVLIPPELLTPVPALLEMVESLNVNETFMPPEMLLTPSPVFPVIVQPRTVAVSPL